MLKFKYLTPSSIKVTIGENYDDNFILTQDEMYDYDFNYYRINSTKFLTKRGKEISKIFYKNKPAIESFFFRSCGM